MVQAEDRALSPGTPTRLDELRVKRQALIKPRADDGSPQVVSEHIQRQQAAVDAEIAADIEAAAIGEEAEVASVARAAAAMAAMAGGDSSEGDD